MRISTPIALVLVMALTGFAQEQPQTLSLLGEPLYAPPLSREARETFDADLAAAQAAFKKDPSSVDAAIAVARADMGLGHVDDALEALTRAKEHNPDNPQLELETARDVIVNRKFDVAERDARKAADTIPEAYCVLGFAQYLKMDYAHAREAYAKCADPGIFAYLSDRFSGGSNVPRPLIDERATPQAAPLRLPGTIVHPGKPEKTLVASYLDAAEHLAAGKRKSAMALLKPIVEKHKDDWMAPAYIAAEADYSRLVKKVAAAKRKK